MASKKFSMGNLGLPKTPEQQRAAADAALAQQMLERARQETAQAAENNAEPQSSSVPRSSRPFPYNRFSRMGGRRKSRKLGNKFNRCVKSVRSTVRARKGSNKESAAIAICTRSVLYPRGRTMKRYRKGRLVTQKKFRGGMWCS